MLRARSPHPSAHPSLTPRQLEDALRWSVWDIAFASMMNTLVAGVFLTGFALALGAEARFIGLMAALPPLTQLMQVPSSWLVQRIGERRRLSLLAFGAARTLYLLMAAIPLLPAGWRLAALLITLGSASLAASLGIVAWASWMRDLVPEGRRGRFFAYRSRIATLVGLSINFLGGIFLDLWKRNLGEQHLGGFMILFVLAVVAGWLSLACVSRIPDLRMLQPEQPARWQDLLARPLRDRTFRRFIAVVSVWNFSLNLSAPFFSVYMLEDLKLPYAVVNGFVILAQVMGLLHIGLWGRLIDTFGNRPVLLFTRFIIANNPLWWLGTTRSNYLAHIFWPHFLGGMTGGGAELSTWNLLLGMSPADYSPLYISAFSAITSLANTAGPAAGGWLASHLREREWVGPFWSLGGLEIVFLISGVMRFLSLLIYTSLPEPRSQPVPTLLRYLARARTWSPLRLIAWLCYHGLQFLRRLVPGRERG